MRYGVFSDVHANLEALEAVLRALDGENVDKLLCAGDLVGYGADPVPCLKRIQATGACVVCGNHDCVVAGAMPLDWFSDSARAAVEWTARQVPALEKEYLGSLPYTWKDGAVTLAHGALDAPKSFHYVTDPASAEACMKAQESSVAFIGHTHVPGVFLREGEGVRFLRAGRVQLESGQKALVNVGSVGQPRDGDPRAAYAVYDTAAGEVLIRRVPYPVEKAQAKIEAAGLPVFLAARLAMGC